MIVVGVRQFHRASNAPGQLILEPQCDRDLFVQSFSHGFGMRANLRYVAREYGY